MPLQETDGKSNVPSLLTLAKNQCIRFSHLITDVGTAPYELVFPILKKMNARQLAEIEKNCPQIRSRSDDLWKLFIARDFPDRPIPDTYYRRTYGKYHKEKEAHLKDASSRLRQSLEKFKREKESRTITPLEVDPQSLRATARRKAASTAPSGSRLIQRAIQSARTKGPLFSPRNTQFHKPGGTMGIPNQIRAPRTQYNSPASFATKTIIPSKRVIGSDPISKLPPADTSKHDGSIESHKKMKLVSSTPSSSTTSVASKPPVGIQPRKKPTSNIFLQRRR